MNKIKQNLDNIYITHDKKILDLSKMSIDEINDLNLYEEEFYAKEIKKKKKFSTERNKYMNYAYKKIFQISNVRTQMKYGLTAKKTNGVNDKTIALLKNLIKDIKQNKQNILFFESGVGEGYALENIINEGINIIGCDVALSKNAKHFEKTYENIKLYQKDLYHALDYIKNNSIDIFYADNMMEHIVCDEYYETCKKIFQKVKKNGIILFVIPNGIVGPNDISQLKLSMGEKATGFHFMEQTYKQNMKIYKNVGLKSKYFCFRNKNKNIIYVNNKVLNYLKENLEYILSIIVPKKILKLVFKRLAYDVYILTKLTK